ncbi:hypothetical protein 2 [Wenling picorna-like virus 5]|uniref:hypothetical protein 2 n=1 Tax=Wenling picorna-like virus 5 TaxID=1923533 RepID=UPI00090C84AE|nr:hypothetical protein 2 [Wenling picorna-like virus 5]APG78486.1 hypothetical protein 2 [Wenling picorna-like virus 5]
MSLMGSEKKEHSIESFAMRPMLMGNFIIPTTVTQGTSVFTYHLIDLLTDDNIKGKLQGFRYFKADIEVSVYYNSQPFQAAGLLATYYPYAGASAAWSQNDSLTGVSGNLSETVSIEDGEPLVLNIPFNHPYGFIDLNDLKAGDLGQFRLVIYSALQSTVPGDSFGVTVYGRFVNPVLYGPTDEPLVLVPQMDCEDEIELSPQSTEAGEQEQKGIVTQVSEVVHNVSTALSDVPIIGVVAKPISWVSGFVNKVASIFGWSKPISVHTTGIYKQAPARYMCNYNGVDTSNNLGLDADNQIQNYSFFGKGDPLDLNSIVTRLNYIQTVPWLGSQAAYTKLASFEVSPAVGWKITQKENTDAVKLRCVVTEGFTHMNFVAQHFKYWRGDIVFQFKCFKTKFHSGRLQISWRPGSLVKASNPKVPMAYTAVWEVAKEKTFSCVVPYMNPKPWLTVETGDEEHYKDGNFHNYMNGVLEIHVLNKLVSSTEAVTAKVSIVVEVCGRNMSFADPVTPKFFPVQSGDVAETLEPESASDETDDADADDEWEDGLEAQIGLEAPILEMVPDGTKNVGIEPEKMAIGEKVTSFRQLIKRFSWFPLQGYKDGERVMAEEFDDICTAHTYKLAGARGYESMYVTDIDHANVSYGLKQATAQNPTGSPKLASNFPMVPDLLGTIAGIYAYSRGSIRLKYDVQDRTALSTDKLHAISYVHLLDSAGKSLDKLQPKRIEAILHRKSALTLTAHDLEQWGEVQIPFYSDKVYTPKNHATYGKESEHAVRISVPMKNDKSDLVVSAWRAAGDDFDFDFIVGVPTCQYFDLDVSEAV